MSMLKNPTQHPQLNKQAMKTMSFISEQYCTQNHNLMMCFHPMHWALKEINNILHPITTITHPQLVECLTPRPCNCFHGDRDVISRVVRITRTHLGFVTCLHDYVY
jgi:hypothetical protein